MRIIEENNKENKNNRVNKNYIEEKKSLNQKKILKNINQIEILIFKKTFLYILIDLFKFQLNHL